MDKFSGEQNAFNDIFAIFESEMSGTDFENL